MEKKFISLKTVIILLVTSIVIPLFFSCDQEEDYEDLEYYPYALYGYVTDYHTGKPLANVTFDLACIEWTYGMGGSNEGETYYGVAKTDSRGYYRIRIPIRNKDVKFDHVYSIPNNIAGYQFAKGLFCVGDGWVGKPFDSVGVRADIRAISYGYLKVIMPKDAIWGLGGCTACYEQPRYEDKLLYSKDINDSLRYEFFRVAADEGWGQCYYNNHNKNYDFKVENPRDTVILYIEQ